MNARIDVNGYLSGGLARAMLNLQREVEASGLDKKLLELVKVRASQINGCAYCIDMHTKDARAHGETEQRLYGLSAWHEAPYYSEKERAALEWTDAVTRIADTHVPDEVYARVSKVIDERELVALTFALVTINGWNRLAVSFRTPPGTYQPQVAAAAHFTPDEVAALVSLIVTINAWNAIAVSTRAWVAGSYQP